MTPSLPASPTTLPPWHEKGLSYGLKLLVVTAFLLLAMILLVTVIMLSSDSIEAVTGNAHWTGTFESDILLW